MSATCRSARTPSVSASALPPAMVGLRDLTLGVLRLDGWTGIAQGLRHHSRRPARLLEALGVS